MLGGAVFFSPSGTMHYQVQIYSLKCTDIQFDTSIHRFGVLTYKCNQKVCNFVYKKQKPYPTWIWAPFQGQLDLLECFQHSSFQKVFFLKSLPGAALFITCVSADSSRPQMPRVNNFPLKLTRMSHKRSSTVMRAKGYKLQPKTPECTFQWKCPKALHQATNTTTSTGTLSWWCGLWFCHPCLCNAIISWGIREKIFLVCLCTPAAYGHRIILSLHSSAKLQF